MDPFIERLLREQKMEKKAIQDRLEGEQIDALVTKTKAIDRTIYDDVGREIKVDDPFFKGGFVK